MVCVEAQVDGVIRSELSPGTLDSFPYWPQTHSHTITNSFPYYPQTHSHTTHRLIPILLTDDSSAQLEGPVSDLLKAIDQTLEIFQTVIYFVLLKDFYMLQTNKIPVGLKGFKHRRDIVFSQAVS